MKIRQQLENILSRLTPGNSRSEGPSKKERKANRRARGTEAQGQTPEVDSRESSPRRNADTSPGWRSTLRAAFSPGRSGVGLRRRSDDSAAVGATEPKSTPRARGFVAAHRVDFLHDAMDARYVPVDPAQIDSHAELLMKPFGERTYKRVSPAEARGIAQNNYQQFKASLLQEAHGQGLDVRRLRFDDASSTLEMEHGAFEMATLFPKTLSAFAPKLAKKPHEFEMERPPWLRSAAPKPTERGREKSGLAERALAKGVKPRPEASLGGGSVDKLLRQACKKGPGLVIGESHREAAPRELLIHGMATLKSAGVTTLYLEHLTDTMQGALDDYARAKPGSRLPADLALYIGARDSNLTQALPFGERREITARRASMAMLVEAAQAHGIRVVAIDTDASYAVSFHTGSDATKSRMQAMNHEAMQKIAQQRSGKWVALVGSAHMNTLQVTGSRRQGNESTPGVAEVTGAVAIAVSDSHDGRATLERDHAVRDKHMFSKLDHLLRLPAQFSGKTSIGSV